MRHDCKQEESESLSAFLACIKDKASLCAFGDQFQNMVRNRFICGIRSSGIRMQLLSSCEDTTTVDRIFELAVMKEQASLDNNVMATVNVVDRQKQNFKPGGNQFNQTNKNNQRSKTKPQYKIICRYCKRPGHFVKDCWKLARKENKSHNVEANSFNSHSEIDTVSYSNNVFSVDQLPICNSLFGDKFSSRPLLDINICGKSLKMGLDTGSTLSYVSNSVFDKLQLDCVVEPCNENLCVANGQFVKASTKAIVSVDFKGKIHMLPLHVVDGKFPTLFGRNWIRVIMGDDWLARLVNLAVNQVRSKKDFISSIKASKLFDPCVGEVNDVSVSLDLKHDSRLKYCKPRPIPFCYTRKSRKSHRKNGRNWNVEIDKSFRICFAYCTRN